MSGPGSLWRAASALADTGRAWGMKGNIDDRRNGEQSLARQQ